MRCNVPAMIFSVTVSAAGAATIVVHNDTEPGDIPGGVAGLNKTLTMVSDHVIQGVADVERLRKKTMKDYILKKALSKELIVAQRKAARQRLTDINDEIRRPSGPHNNIQGTPSRMFPCTTPDAFKEPAKRTGAAHGGFTHADGEAAYGKYVDTNLYHCMPNDPKDCSMAGYRESAAVVKNSVTRMSLVMFQESDVSPDDLKIEAHPGVEFAPVGLFRVETLLARADYSSGDASHADLPVENHPQAFIHSKATILHEAKLALRTALSAVLDGPPDSDLEDIHTVEERPVAAPNAPMPPGRVVFVSKPTPKLATTIEFYRHRLATTADRARLEPTDVNPHVVYRLELAKPRETAGTLKSGDGNGNRRVNLNQNAGAAQNLWERMSLGVRPGRASPDHYPESISAASYYAHDRRLPALSPLKREIGSGTPFEAGAKKLKDIKFNDAAKSISDPDFYVLAKCDKQKLNPLAPLWPVLEFGASPDTWCNGQFATVSATGVSVAYKVVSKLVESNRGAG